VTGVVKGADGIRRCAWGAGTPDYVVYHDEEWGRPVVDETRLYEKLCLEGFQSGLSWLTILRKRQNFRSAFAGFDVDRVARFTDKDVQRLLQDEGIVRHRGKIEATIANARATITARDQYGSLAALLWSFEPSGRRRAPREMGDIPATSPESKAASKALLALGYRFVGPTTVYAAMQSLGIVNDHLVGCAARAPCESARRANPRPVPSRSLR
jgi:DNA-3-methyladenine glycosylase I